MKRIHRLIVRSGVVLLLGAPVHAQAQSQPMGSPLRADPTAPVYVSVRAHADRIPALARPIALELEDLPLDRALAQIAAQTGLRLTYSTDLLPQEHRVSLRTARMTAADALLRVLRGTSLDLLVAPSGHAVLVACPPGRCRAGGGNRRAQADPLRVGRLPRSGDALPAGRSPGRPAGAPPRWMRRAAFAVPGPLLYTGETKPSPARSAWADLQPSSRPDAPRRTHRG